MMDRLETYFDAFYAYFTTEIVKFFKKIGQFENLGFVIMSTRENIRLIARTPFFHPPSQEKSYFWQNSGAVALIIHSTKNLLSRYTAGSISDNNSRRIFSEVKY